MNSIKIQRLLPAPVNAEEIKRWCGPSVVVSRVGDKAESSFVIYGKQSEDVSVVKGKMRDYAQSKNLILVSGNEGIGKNEMYGKPFFQFFLKLKPSKKPGPPSTQPQALPSQPSKPLVNSSKPIPTLQPTQQDVSKKPQQRYQDQNRLGWTKDGFQSFYRMTKPGSSWTFIQKNIGNPVENDAVGEYISDFFSLFGNHAPYRPLEEMFGKLGAIHNKISFDHDYWEQKYGHAGENFATRDKSEYIAQAKQLMARIQPRLERLYDFARRQALVKTMAKRMVMKSLGKRLI